MEPAHGESFPSGQRRGPAAPGEDTPDDKSFHTSTTPTNWGRKLISPGSIPPRTVWEPQPHWLIANWLGLMESARGEGFPSRQRRGLAGPGEDRVLSRDQKYFHISTTPTTREQKQISPRSIPFRTVWKSQPHWPVADWLGLAGVHGASAQREFPLGTTSWSRRTRGGYSG